MIDPNGPKPGNAADKRYRQLRDQEGKARGNVKRRGKGKARKDDESRALETQRSKGGGGAASPACKHDNG